MTLFVQPKQNIVNRIPTLKLQNSIVMKFRVSTRVGTGDWETVNQEKLNVLYLGLWLGPGKHEPSMQENFKIVNFKLGFYRTHSMSTECRLESQHQES